MNLHPILRLLVYTATCVAGATPRIIAQTEAPTKDATHDDAFARASALESHFERLARESYATVVSITSLRRVAATTDAEVRAERANWIRDPLNETDYPGHERIGVGSGVIVSEDGEILTCRHFLMDADGDVADLVSAETPDRRHTICDVIALEPTLDLAVLKLRVYLETDPPEFSVATLGDSATARAGHWAFAVGNPVGPEQFFAAGLVTTPPNRDCYQEQLSATYLQTSLTMHPEAYGGPLLNARGEVIGITLPRIVQPGPTVEQPVTGITFAMPSNILVGIYQALRQVKSYRSPWLGFAVMSRTELRRELGPAAFNALAKPRFGIYLENVFEPSPATRAGLRPGDFLVHFDGEPVYSPLAFQKLLYLAGIGSTVELEIFREGESRTVELLIEERPETATFR